MMFNRIPIACTICGAALRNDIDVYGDARWEVCRDCHWVELEDYTTPRPERFMSGWELIVYLEANKIDAPEEG